MGRIQPLTGDLCGAHKPSKSSSHHSCGGIDFLARAFPPRSRQRTIDSECPSKRTGESVDQSAIVGVAIAPARFWADSPRAESFSQFVSTSRTQVKCRLSRAPVAVQAAHAADGETEVVGLQHFYPTDLLRQEKKTPVGSDRGVWRFDSIGCTAKSGLLHARNRRGRRGLFGCRGRCRR